VQFATLLDMLAGWRDAGIGYDRLEVWAVGYAGQEERVEDMANESTACIMIDTVPEDSAISIYGAHANDIFVIDADGNLVMVYNVGVNQLTLVENRNAFNDIVMGILGE
jgi:hypothetical protein